MDIKKWVERESYEYSRKVVKDDARGRSYKVANSLIEKLNANESELKEVIQTAELEMPPAMPSHYGLEELVELNRIYRKQYLSAMERLIIPDYRLKRMEQELEISQTSCDEYFKDNLLPPVDIASAAALKSGESFQIYLGMGFNFGGGSGGVDPAGTGLVNAGGNGGIIEKIVDELINKPISHLFATEEEKNALKDAARIFQENLPKEEERRNIAVSACKDILKGDFKKIESQKQFIQGLRTEIISSLNLIQFNMSSSERMVQEQLSRKDTERRKTAYLENVASELFSARSQVLGSYGRQLERAVGVLIDHVHLGTCNQAVASFHAASQSLRIFDDYLQAGDLNQFNRKSLAMGGILEKQRLNLLAKGCKL
ncbi:MAG: hypothetical protein ACO3A2_11170 [Bdellovibrionia bacterium]